MANTGKGDDMAKRTCSIDGCDRKHYGRGWCSLHYKRWYEHGDPERTDRRVIVSKRGATDSERFWDRVDVGGPDECWEFLGYRRAGYGRFQSPELGVVTASRFAYEDQVGPIPEGLLICHTCDNPPCVNPRHLWPGTVSDNAQDMVDKGRHVAQASPEVFDRGEDHHITTLTRAEVIEMRRLRTQGLTYASLGDLFGVTRVTASNICRGKTWSHVPDYLT